MSDAWVRERLQRLEDQVRALSAHVGLPYEDPAAGVPPDVVALAREGKMIHAIKAYRDHTGCGLDEAKRVVEQL